MALKRFTSKANVGPVGLSSTAGIVRGANAVSEGLLGAVKVFDTMSDIARTEGANEAKIAGNIAGQSAELSRDPETGNIVLPEDTGGNFSIYDQVYRDAILSKYQSKLQTDIASTLHQFAADNIDNQAGFYASSDAYIQTVLEGVDPRVRNAVTLYADQQRNQYGGKIGDFVSRTAYAAAKTATDQAITLSTNDVLNAVRASYDDPLNNKEFADLYSIAINNIRESGRFNGGNLELVEMKIETLNRRISAKKASKVFSSLNEIGKAQAIDSVINQKGEFWDGNKGLHGLTEAERKNVVTGLKAIAASTSAVRNANEQNYLKMTAGILIKHLLGLTTPAEKEAVSQLPMSDRFPILNLNLMNSVLGGMRSAEGIGRARAAEVRRVMNEKLDEKASETAWNGMIAKFEGEGGEGKSIAIHLQSIVDHEKTFKGKIKLINPTLKWITSARSENDKERIKEINANFIRSIMPKLGPAANAAFNRILADDPNAMDDIPSTVMAVMTKARGIEITEEKEARRQAKDLLAQAKRDNIAFNEKQSIADITLWIKTQAPKAWGRISEVLEDEKDPQHPTNNTQVLSYLTHQMRQISTVSTSHVQNSMLDIYKKQYRNFSARLGKDPKGTEAALEAIMTGVRPGDALSQLTKVTTDMVSEINALEKQQAIEGPIYRAIKHGLYNEVNKDSGSAIENVMRKHFKAKNDENGTDLDPTNPGTWFTEGILNAGIPQSGIEIMKLGLSDDPVARTRAMAFYRTILKHPKGRDHLDKQLGSSFSQQLFKLSEFALNTPQGKLDDYVKAMRESGSSKGGTSLIQANRELLPDAFKDGKYSPTKGKEAINDIFDWLQDKVADDIQDDFEDENDGKTIELTAEGGEFIVNTGIFSSSRKVGSMPKEFRDRVEKLALATLHLYQNGTDTAEVNARFAFKSAYNELLATPGPGSFQWSTLSSAAPGVHEPGMINLVKDSPMQYFGVNTVGGGKSVAYIEPIIMQKIQDGMHKKHNPGWWDGISFNENIRLNIAGYKTVKGLTGNEAIPLYTIRIIDKDNYTTIYEMMGKDNKPLVIDLEEDYLKAQSHADWDVLVDFQSRRMIASVKAAEHQRREETRKEILSGKGVFGDRLKPSEFDAYDPTRSR